MRTGEIIDLKWKDMLPQVEEFFPQEKMTGLGEYLFVNIKRNHFSSSTGLPHPSEKILKSIQLQYRGIYQTRHTFVKSW